MAAGEILWLAPWIFAPLLGALIVAARRGRGDERRLFLLCLSLPPILAFTLTPLWGARGLPHWPMPGWFFVYPLLGAWLSEGWAKSLRFASMGDRLDGAARRRRARVDRPGGDGLGHRIDPAAARRRRSDSRGAGLG